MGVTPPRVKNCTLRADEEGWPKTPCRETSKSRRFPAILPLFGAWPKSIVFGHACLAGEAGKPVVKASSVSAARLSVQFFPFRGWTPTGTKVPSLAGRLKRASNPAVIVPCQRRIDCRPPWPLAGPRISRVASRRYVVVEDVGCFTVARFRATNRIQPEGHADAGRAVAAAGAHRAAPGAGIASGRGDERSFFQNRPPLCHSYHATVLIPPTIRTRRPCGGAGDPCPRLARPLHVIMEARRLPSKASPHSSAAAAGSFVLSARPHTTYFPIASRLAALPGQDPLSLHLEKTRGFRRIRALSSGRPKFRRGSCGGSGGALLYRSRRLGGAHA